MENQSKNVNQPGEKEQLNVMEQELVKGPIAVDPNELGIAEDVSIALDPDSSKTKLTFSEENGQVVMNLRLTFKPQPGKIEFGPATVVAKWLAAFNLTDPNKNFYDRGELQDLFLNTDRQGGVTLTTSTGNLKLITNAKKKLSGSTVAKG